MFVGRERELAVLVRALDRVRDALGHGDAEPGRCVLVRGRRRVGKSRLVEELCRRAAVPTLFMTASRQGARELEVFAHEVRASNLPGREVFAGVDVTTWDAALGLLAAALPSDEPAIVVIDEFPYLVDDDPSIEAVLQKQWDRRLSRLPVLLLVVGSDLAMMEALDTYGRPFHGRGTEMVVPPLSPVETAAIVGAPDAASALDAHLITGGLPLVCSDWPRGTSMWDHLGDALSDPTSSLIVSGERTLAAEFPTEASARTVLERIGSGERTFTNIARAAGGMQAATLARALDTLQAKRVVARDVPLSTRPSKEARYRVSDPYLRFWLRFVGPGIADIERGRPDRVLERIRRDWSAWRGRAIEPVVRDAIDRLAGRGAVPDAAVVGGYWTRRNVPAVDIVGADRGPVAGEIRFAGTIKWRDRAPLDTADVDRLVQDLAAVPGAAPGTPLVAVALAGVTGRVDAALGPEEILQAFAAT